MSQKLRLNYFLAGFLMLVGCIITPVAPPVGLALITGPAVKLVRQQRSISRRRRELLAERRATWGW